MDTSGAFAAAASATHIVAFVMYNRQLLRGKSAPKVSSWFIWAFVTTLNFTSYGVMSGDIWKTLLPTISSLLCILTFVLTLFTGRWVHVDRADQVAALLAVAAGIVWRLFHTAQYANLMIQGAIAVGFIPTIRSVWKKPSDEPPLPWFVWTVAFGMGLSVVLLRWTGQWQEAVYYISCILLHAGIALLALRREPVPAPTPM